MDDVMIEYGNTIKSPQSSLLLMHLGGQTSRIGETDTAAGNCDVEYIVGIQSQWEDAADDDIHVGWAHDFWTALSPYSTGGTYVNFLSDDTDAERMLQAWGAETYDRLVEVKAKYDPGNMFRSNQSIAQTA
jgi:Berberine and berberine like